MSTGSAVIGHGCIAASSHDGNASTSTSSGYRGGSHDGIEMTISGSTTSGNSLGASIMAPAHGDDLQLNEHDDNDDYDDIASSAYSNYNSS
jgi:hypothetical protein